MTGPSEGPRTARLACIQMEPVVGRPDQNLEKALALLDAARREGADLAVLPELSNSGYVFETRAEAIRARRGVPEGRVPRPGWPLAARRGMTVVAGVAERAATSLFNSAVVIGPDGYIGTYRKMHLWAAENLFFEPGNLGFPVFRTPIGRIGMAICYDGWFPETYRLRRCRAPTSSACRPTGCRSPASRRPPAMANILAMAGRPCQLGLHRRRRPHRHRARPALPGPQPDRGLHRLAGRRAREPRPDEILSADVDLAEARASARLNEFNQILRDRRTDIYGWEQGTPSPADPVG